VLRDERGRGGSVEVHEQAQVGRVLKVCGPRNHFELLPADEYLFVAGGIGITPIQAMIESAESQGTNWSLLYGGRTRRHMAFADGLQAAYPGKVALVPQDTSGILDLDSAIASSAPGAIVYACGPEPMLLALSEACRTASPPRTLRLERFAPVKSDEDDSSNTAFELELRRSGIRLEVPADRSILEVAREVVPRLPFSCKEGVCGSCEAGVLEGVPDHRDSVLTDEERESNETMMICVGRSRTARLVLDL
jgi:ferredoxin-NADP reductase